jgi:beta-glucosidase
MSDSFPAGFLWGAATSAYQVEGAPLADGAGPSIWHRFAHTPGNTAHGETGDVACDHYHRWREDCALMRQLGLQSYRFSISWARVLPAGRGRSNSAGLAFYDRLVDALLAAGIAPSATLYHWDLPAALADRGGWTNPEIRGWFGEYAALMYRTLGDRVAFWSTLNEPWVVVDAGYLHGAHAPGHRSAFEAAAAAHELLCAHGTAVQAFRASGARGLIGIVVNLEPKYPATTSEADRLAAERADAYMNRQYLDPLLRGEYPAELRTVYGEAWLERPPADLSLIRQPIDFLGINYYTRGVTRHDDDAWPLRASLVPQPQHPHTTLGPEWEVYPPGLTRGRCSRCANGTVTSAYNENGAAS